MEIETADLSLARSAVSALMQELEAYPKPGLVSPRDSGAHADMGYDLMRRSANALLLPFADIAAAGREGLPFQGSLIPLGLAAEREMLRATGGVNTHRGAIFTLGMLVAAMARAESAARPTTPGGIRAVLLETWGEALQAHAASDGADTNGAKLSGVEQASRLLSSLQEGSRDGRPTSQTRLNLVPFGADTSHGATVRKTTGAGGARAEAGRGFPGIFETGIPVYREALASGLDINAARIQTLFALMESAEDSNVIFRGGCEAADFVRRTAAEFLEVGGCFSGGWFVRAEELHREFIRRNLSPGGCADLLSGTLLVVGFDHGGGIR